MSPDALYNGNWLVQDQQAQITYYYCGPAALSEALGQRSISVNQNTAASDLGTTTNGTAWSGVYVYRGATGYPMPDALNMNIWHQIGWYYTPQALPYYPSSTDLTNYENNFTYDIDTGFPVIGDAWEVPGGPHLVGHPDATIFHWFDIRGYGGYSADTFYEDSASGAEGLLGWRQGSVPPYSWLPSSTILTILGGRGYVW